MKTICKKCNSSNIVIEPRTKIISPNVYKLYNEVICRTCSNLEIVDLGEVDKNTENTRKLLTGNYIVNKNGEVVLKKSQKPNLKDLAEQAQKELKVDELFKDNE